MKIFLSQVFFYAIFNGNVDQPDNNYGTLDAMGKLKEIVKRTPIISPIYKELYRWYYRYQLKSKNTEHVFTAIYRADSWHGKDSVSGPGSEIEQTKVVINELPTLLKKINISKMLDIPCGDFHWMKNVDLSGIDYIGADVVKKIIINNRENYARDGISFQHLNLIEDKLPKVDLVFCRDCLVHFSNANVLLALKNIFDSQSEYLLTTTFIDRKENQDINTGQWRALNLELPPFMLPKPIEIIVEENTESDGAYKDKALGLWRISDIRESLSRHSA